MTRISDEDAGKIAAWIEAGRGVAIWPSVDLSRPSARIMTPARTDGADTGKPSWYVASKPGEVIEKLEGFEVAVYREVRRFHVAVRLGAQGMTMKCTDASSRKIHVALEKAGEEAVYHFDYDTQEAIIMVPGEVVPLPEWRKSHAG